MALKCPEGMVLISAGGAVHPDEPAYCLNKTEITQEADNAFWAARLKAGHELLITLVNGGKDRITNPSRKPLEEEAQRRISIGGVSDIHIGPVVADDKPQPEGKLAGPKKPAVYRSWNDAVEFCQGTYKGGNLPTIRQWEKACGSGEYCTKDGILDHTRAVYWNIDKKDDDNGPMDVGSTPANANGIKDMTGNVWEWLRDATADGAYRYFTGGSWSYYDPDVLRATGRGYYLPGYGYGIIGFRCVASPEDFSN